MEAYRGLLKLVYRKSPDWPLDPLPGGWVVLHWQTLGILHDSFTVLGILVNPIPSESLP